MSRGFRGALPVGSYAFGAVGKVSRRLYDPDKIGIPIEKRSSKGVKIDDKGIEIVASHLERFGKFSPNEEMLRRLKAIANGKLKATRQDRNFYTHELRENERYIALGCVKGVPADPFEAYEHWNNAHTATLEEYNIRHEKRDLYHPDARAKMPQAFGAP